MYLKQLSVFIENRKGRLEEVAEELSKNNINIIALSLADTNEYGLLRMIVSDPEKAKQVLKSNGFSAMLTDTLAVRLPHAAGMLQKLLKLLTDAGLNVEYMYGFATSDSDSSIIVKTADVEAALEAVKNGGLEVFDPKSIYGDN